MPDHRVDDLSLRVRSRPGREAASREEAERFLRRAIEIAGDRLEARWPARLFLVRELALDVQLGEGRDSFDARVPERFAEILVKAIEAASRGEGSPAARDVVVFDDESSWRAAYLESRAAGAGADAWCFAALRAEGEPIRVLIDSGRGDLAESVLATLGGRGTLIDVVATLRESEVHALARAVGLRIELRSGTDDVQPIDLAPGEVISVLTRRLRASRRHLGDPAAALVAVVELRQASNASLEVAARAASAVLAAAERRVGVRPSATATEDSERVRRDPGRRPMDADERTSGEDVSLGSEISEERSAGSDEAGSAEATTEFAGLFYLLSLAMELGYGEILWKVCLPEGATLASGFRALIGERGAGDAALRVFAGPRRSCRIEVSIEQQADVCADTLVGLVDALPRRGLAAYPEVALTLAETVNGRCLVASSVDDPFPLFAWPSPTIEAAERGMDVFLARWPASAPAPVAAPALAELDGRARVRWGRPDDVASVWLPTDECTAVHALAVFAQLTGSLCHLLRARSGVEMDGLGAFVTRWLELPGRVRQAGEELKILLPMERIDMALRRAGIDRDPGWVPWLERRVVFEFVSTAEESTEDPEP